MTLEQYLEKDKEKLLQRLEQTDSPEKTRSVLEAQIDRLLYEYNEDERNPEQQSAAAALLRTGRMTMQLVDCLEPPEVWKKDTPVPSGKSGKHTGSLLLAFGGILFLILLLADVLYRTGFSAGLSIIRYTLLAAAAAVCLFFSGYLKNTSHGHFQDADEDRLIRQKADAYKTYSALHSMILQADQSLTMLHNSVQSLPVREQPVSEMGSAGQDESSLALYAGLLEALYSQDGKIALERLEQMRYYLHTHGIETEDYTPENSEWFDRMPGSTDGIRTLRPALIKNGSLISRGLAAGGTIV